MKDQEDNSLYFSFAEVIRLHHLRIHSLVEDMGLYHGQFRVLFVLSQEKEAMRQKELSERLNISPATLTVMIKRMEKAGLVYRLPDPKDQRVSRVYLTDDGKETIKEAKVALDMMKEDCFGNFSQDEEEDFGKLLEKLKKNLDQALER